MATAWGASCHGRIQLTVAPIDANPAGAYRLVAVEMDEAAYGAPSVAFDAPLNVRPADVVVLEGGRDGRRRLRRQADRRRPHGRRQRRGGV